MSRHAAGNGTPSFEPPTDQPKPRRKRVVLADSRAPVTVLRTVVELEVTYLVLGVLLPIPLLLLLVPQLDDVSIAGLRLPWLLLGVLPFPLLFGAAYWFNQKAESHERAFVDMVEH
jgi:hypothetical protein